MRIIVTMCVCEGVGGGCGGWGQRGGHTNKRHLKRPTNEKRQLNKTTISISRI